MNAPTEIQHSLNIDTNRFLYYKESIECCDINIFSSSALQQEIYGQVTIHDAFPTSYARDTGQSK